MIFSYSKELNPINLPFYRGEVSMLPFNLEDLSSLPGKFRVAVEQMMEKLPKLKGEAFLTVHGKFIKKDRTLRRGGPHIDGNYIKQVSDWGTGGWKVGQEGNSLSSEHHALSYKTLNGGMLIASNYSSCKGWNGSFNGEPGVGGDCSHIKLNKGFMLKADTVYYGGSQFVHESLPVSEDVFRLLYRITLPIIQKPITKFN
jgi:hypothetical protein